MKVALRAVAFNRVVDKDGKEVSKTIYSIFENVPHEIPPGGNAADAFAKKDGYLNAAATNVIQMAMEDVAKGFANHLELHFKEYPNES